MAKDWTSPVGSLWRLDGAAATEMDTGIILANGIGFSPDDRVFYFTDFARRTIFAYPFDVASGTLGERRVFLTIDGKDGKPDGMTVDAEGHVWIAHWDGWCVTRHDPGGPRSPAHRHARAAPHLCGFRWRGPLDTLCHLRHHGPHAGGAGEGPALRCTLRRRDTCIAASPKAALFQPRRIP